MALTTQIPGTHTAFTVTAHLMLGVVCDPPYALDLAGILATRMRRVEQVNNAARGIHRRLPDTTEEEVDDMPLPLATCHPPGDEDGWHWLATCAIFPPGPTLPGTYYRQVDHVWLQSASGRPIPSTVQPGAGPYRDMMMPYVTHAVPTLTWRAIGDMDTCQDLLTPVTHIGRRRSVGEGKVLNWEFTPHPHTDPAWVHHEGNEILRPVPPHCAETLGVAYQTGWHARRPPSWHPTRLGEVAKTVEDPLTWWTSTAD